MLCFTLTIHVKNQILSQLNLQNENNAEPDVSLDITINGDDYDEKTEPFSYGSSAIITNEKIDNVNSESTLTLTNSNGTYTVY
jgi:hypothetical protein